MLLVEQPGYTQTLNPSSTGLLELHETLGGRSSLTFKKDLNYVYAPPQDN